MTQLVDIDYIRNALGITGTAESCKGCRYNAPTGFVCNTYETPSFAYVCEVLDDAPIVDAIPIEAIVERIENEHAETESRYVLAELYMEWRHENDRFDEDDRFNDLPPLEERLPVRHAPWITGKSDGHVRCSLCGTDYDWTTEAQYYNYCPNCGARVNE